ncbi:aldehyde dehydrogenase family protein [Streptomyces sp. NPDC004230]
MTLQLQEKSCFVGGDFVQARGAWFDVVNPADEEVLTRLRAADDEDVAVAVAAASAAASRWAATPLEERIALLKRVRTLIARDGGLLAACLTTDLGMPVAQCFDTQVGWCLRVIDDVLASAPEALQDEQVHRSLIRRVPLGVSACITPWNFPLHQIMSRAAEALMAGCPVVVKPSELAPLAPLEMARLFAEAGFPPGVFNLLTGAGATGAALVRHPDVRLVSFTGSTGRGREVAGVAGQQLKRCSLELGGKSPSVLLDAALVEQATRVTAESCFFNSGQLCTALTRFIVPWQVLDEVTDLAQELVGAERVGDPQDPETTIGPLVSSAQRDRVQAFVDAAAGTATTAVVGKGAPPRGYYVRPAVFLGVAEDSALATREVFGPVLAVLSYRTEEEAVAMANAGPYGLAARVWCRDEERAIAMADRIDAGQVGINDSAFDGRAPFGGFKQSGIGRSHGVFGIREFTEIKALPLTAQPKEADRD